MDFVEFGPGPRSWKYRRRTAMLGEVRDGFATITQVAKRNCVLRFRGRAVEATQQLRQYSCRMLLVFSV